MKRNKIVFAIAAFIIGMMLSYSCQSPEQKYAGTWSSPGNKIVVKLNANTMKADVTILLGDTPISYTSDWEIIKGHGILFKDYYGQGRASIIGFDGKLYSYDSYSGRKTFDNVIMRHVQ